MYTLTLFLVFLVSWTSAREYDFCFAEEDEPYLYMGTKTAYHFVHGGKTRFQSVPNCQPVQIWMLAAHGTSYPTADEIERMLTLVDLQNHILRNHETRNNGHMCNRDLENLKRWNPHTSNLAMEMADILTPQGVEDMKLLARRLQSNFPELLQPSGADITSTNYKFRSTTVPPSRASLEAFMEGLFGSSTAVYPEEPFVNDTTLTTYKMCDVWKNREADESVDNTEQQKFDAGSQFENIVQNVSRRLGFLYNISGDSIVTMYDMCRYEKAWSVTQLSPWCAVFSKEELRILEYREDLHYYYYAGYGRDINTRLGCPLVKNMMLYFWKFVQQNSTDDPRGIFYFADKVSLLNLLTTMGMIKDQMQLTPFNYKDTVARQWRTSFISPFAANLVVVFYRCNNNREPSKVMFYLAEKPVLLDGCKVGLCDWEYLVSKFSSFARDCKLDVCMSQNGAGSAISLSFFASLLFVCTSLVSSFAHWT